MLELREERVATDQGQSQVLTVVIVNHIKNTHFTAVHKAVAHEIHAPAFIGRQGLRQCEDLP